MLFKKKWLSKPAISGMVLVVIFVVMVSLFLRRRTKKMRQTRYLPSPYYSPVLTKKTSPQKIFTAEEIAKQTLSFLNKQKRADGFYNFFSHYEDLCKERKDLDSCPLKGRNLVEPANMWVLLARLSFYQNFSHKKRDLLQAETDAQILIDFCNRQKEKCVAVLMPIFKLYQQTGKEKYKNFLKIMGEELLREKEEGNDVMIMGIKAREEALLYQLFSNINYLVNAKRRVFQAKQISQERKQKEGRFSEAACYIVLAEMEISKAARDKSLAKEAAVFLISDKVKQLEEGPLTLIQPCIEAAYESSRFLSDNRLKKIASKMMDKYIINRWDPPILKRRYGEGGFLLGEGETPINITDAGYMVYLLGYEKDKQYLFNIRENVKN